MDRSSLPFASGYKLWLWVALLAAPLAGCNVLATALYVVRGPNVKAEFAELEGKRVAVICRPSSSVQYRATTVSKDFARSVGVLLEKNNPKIHVVKPAEVNQQIDESNQEDYQQIGRALKADMVVAIDLEEFSMMLNQNLYQGKANISISVFDTHKVDNEPAWEKHLPQVVYPPNSPISVGDATEQQFRRNFINVLSEQVARHFYEHDPTSDFANDSTALE